MKMTHERVGTTEVYCEVTVEIDGEEFSGCATVKRSEYPHIDHAHRAAFRNAMADLTKTIDDFFADEFMG